MNDAPFQEIKYVSHLLRSKLKSQDIAHSSATTVNQDRYISANFWGFVKRVIEKGSAILPSFSQNHCTHFFIKMFSAALPCKKFTIPHWIPSFNQPSFAFDQSAPSYEKATRVIRRIKSSGSDYFFSDYLIIQQTQNYYRYIQHLITITNNDNYNNINYK